MTANTTALAPRDLLILATLAEQPCHGYGLIKRVEARSAAGSVARTVRLDPANLYRVLRRMRRDEWVDEVTSDGRRKVYGITETGKQVLHNEVARLEQLLQQTQPALASGRD